MIRKPFTFKEIFYIVKESTGNGCTITTTYNEKDSEEAEIHFHSSIYTAELFLNDWLYMRTLV